MAGAGGARIEGGDKVKADCLDGCASGRHALGRASRVFASTTRVALLSCALAVVAALTVLAAPIAVADPVLDPDAWVTNGPVYAIAQGPDGTTYIGGQFTYVGPNNGTGVPTTGGVARNNIAALGGDGRATSWNPNASYGGLNCTVRALAVSASGTVYAGGDFSSIGGAPRNRIAALNSAGLATTWNPNANNTVEALAVGSTGTVYAGGTFTNIGTAARNCIAALNSGGTAANWDPNASFYSDCTVHTLAVGANGTVYAGGFFNHIGAAPRNRIAALDGSGRATNWDPDARAATEVASTVLALALSPGGTVYAGGAFTSFGEPYGANHFTRNRIGALGSSGIATNWDPDANGNVRALGIAPNGTVYAGGEFTSIGAAARNRLAALNNSGSGMATSWDPNLNGTVRALTVNSTGTVYAGGDFTRVGGASGPLRYYLARFVDAPAVTTGAQTMPSYNAATAYGSVVSDGGALASVSDRGVYVSTAAGFSPPAQGTKVPATVPTGSGSFTCSLTGLRPATTYYARAYATNGVGTAFGEQISFRTTATPTAPTLTLSGGGSAWHRTPVTLKCSATLDPLCSLAALQYRSRTSSSWSSWQDLPSTGPSRSLVVSAEGRNEVEARVNDSAGGSATDSAIVRIDSRKPTTTAFGATARQGKQVKLAYKVNDPATGCGSAAVTLKIFRGKQIKKTLKLRGTSACNSKRSYKWKCTLPAGSYTLKVYATDIAGNPQSKIGKATLRVQ
jgi:hypothetical protein